MRKLKKSPTRDYAGASLTAVAFLLNHSSSLVLLVHADLVRVSFVLALPRQKKLLSATLIQRHEDVRAKIARVERNVMVCHLLTRHHHLYIIPIKGGFTILFK